MSARLIDNPEIAATAGLIFDRLLPVQAIIREASMARYPEVDREAIAWVNGAFYGMVAAWGLLSGAEEIGMEEVDSVYAGYVEFFTEVIDNHGGDTEAAIRALVPNLD